MLRRPLEPKQYTSLAFGRRCDEMGVRPSMGSVGDAYDNAMCESFFATLECELIDRRTWRTQAEARISVFRYIEGWYNPHRRHSALDYPVADGLREATRDEGEDHRRPSGAPDDEHLRWARLPPTPQRRWRCGDF